MILCLRNLAVSVEYKEATRIKILSKFSFFLYDLFFEILEIFTDATGAFEEIFFSFTHASDPIGIAAADFMLDYLDKDFFLQLNKKTTQLFTYINDVIKNIEKPELRLSATSYPGKIALFAENQSLSLQPSEPKISHSL